jgi:hypothetical protein
MLYLAVTETWGSNAQKNPAENHRVSVEIGPLCPLRHIGRNSQRLIEVPVRRRDHAFHFVLLERLRHDVEPADIQDLRP